MRARATLESGTSERVMILLCLCRHDDGRRKNGAGNPVVGLTQFRACGEKTTIPEESAIWRRSFFFLIGNARRGCWRRITTCPTTTVLDRHTDVQRRDDRRFCSNVSSAAWRSISQHTASHGRESGEIIGGARNLFSNATLYDNTLRWRLSIYDTN